MIDWNKLVENGKQYGVEYHFYDDFELKPCSCGGKAKMYSKENKNKKFSFEHLHIRCEKCNKSVSAVYDVSGNPNETYKEKSEAIKDIVQRWNSEEKSIAELLTQNKFNGVFPTNQNEKEYDWNMPGKPKNQ